MSTHPPRTANRSSGDDVADGEPTAGETTNGSAGTTTGAECSVALRLDDGDQIGLNADKNTLAPIVWAMNRSDRARLRDLAGPCTDVVALWNCPVCSRSVPRFRRPGRHAVYCSNACKQKAYRHRCIDRNRRMIDVARNPRPRRARTRDGIHAARETVDLSTGRRDSAGRGITMCGAFAEMSIDAPHRFSHTRFLATSGPSDGSTCKRCVQLSCSPVREPGEVRRAILDHHRRSRSHTPSAA